MSSNLEQFIINLLAVLLVTFSASIHEFGHAMAAHLCGDDTAKEAGSLTINPLAHIDPFGSVVMPLLLVMSGLGYMAYAKPVPYNPYRLKNPQRDEAIVALAGPASNIAQALVGALLYHLLAMLLFGVDGQASLDSPLKMVLYWLVLLTSAYVQINCSLAFFNLLPIPPLDGSKIISPFFKGESRRIYYQIQQYAFPVTLAVIFLLPTVLHIDPIGWYLNVTAGNLGDLLLG